MEPSQTTDKTRKSADILKAELERKKRDLWKVYNPTNQDFQVVLNAAISPEVWTVQAKEEAIIPWYVAEKYFEEMSEKIIYAKSDKMVLEENEKRTSKGFDKMDLHTSQPRFEGKNLKILLSKKEQIVAVLNRGLYKEYGVEKSGSQLVDTRTQRDTFDPGEALSAAGIEATTTTPSAPAEPPRSPEMTPSVDPLPPTPPLDPNSNSSSFKCSVCGKEVTTQFALTGHMRSHTPEVELAPPPPSKDAPLKVEEEEDE